jgi:phospholipid/cholesterol/gamma-HCH transport system substrate-binding protein
VLTVLTRRTKIQLAVFALLSVFGIVTIGGSYLDLPHLLGYQQYRVAAQFTDATGLSSGALVTYRGVKVGKIDAVRLGPDNLALVDLAIDDGVTIPADVLAQANSTSAIGEQYLELLPQTDGGPLLHEGSVLSPDRTSNLPSTSKLLTSVTSLAHSVPKDQTLALLSGLTDAFTGGAGDVSTLVGSTQGLVHEANANVGSTTDLIRALQPFLLTQQQNAGALRSTTTDLAFFTDQLRVSDPDLSKLVSVGPMAADEVTGLVQEISPDLSMLVYDLGSTGQVLKVYLPAVKQILVLHPAVAAALQSGLSTFGGADPGAVHLTVRPNVGDPPLCYPGYLPIAGQRDFQDQTVRKTLPQNLHCKVPANDPRDVRGARNTPCLNNPGKRAASVEGCLSVPDGSITNPVPGKTTQPALTGTYDPVSGNALTSNGLLFHLGGLGPDNTTGAIKTWQQLLLP